MTDPYLITGGCLLLLALYVGACVYFGNDM